MTDNRARTTGFLGVEFDDLGLDAAIEWVREKSVSHRFNFLVTPNVNHIVRVHSSELAKWVPAFRDAIDNSDLCLNDSRVLTILARLSGISLKSVSGSDLTRELVLGHRVADGVDVVLVGGDVAEATWLSAALPDHKVHHYAAPMGILDDANEQIRIAEFVEQFDRALVFLAFGVPQSELVAHLISIRGRARGTGLCIGASIEFLSGTQRRAAPWMRRAALEWLHRLLSEPRRMWRRYLVEGPQIFRIWWRHRPRRSAKARW